MLLCGGRFERVISRIPTDIVDENALICRHTIIESKQYIVQWFIIVITVIFLLLVQENQRMSE